VNADTLHACPLHFPGAALELSADGLVLASNGHLDALAGRDRVGLPLADVLDATSRPKRQRLLSEADSVNPACTWELVLTTPTSLELRTFLAVWARAESATVLWLLEYSVDPKLELLYGELSDLNRDLTDAQRKLSRDKTRLARALEKANSAIRTRDEILAIVSHDLRNPVSTIAMAASLLEMPIPEEKKAEQVRVIQRAAAGMNRLISDLLDVSAIEAGRFTIEPTPLSLSPLLREACRMFERQAAQRHQQLEFLIPEDLPRVYADRDRILQVLSNLVGNAIKFTPDGCAIRVRATRGDAELVVSVEDTGPGIPEADVLHIFDRFWRARRSKRGGAGLGLDIARGIVEAHGGRIRVESAPGRGSIFSFTLPLVGEEAGSSGEETTHD
jgi:signal transduction histidine kinase